MEQGWDPEVKRYFQKIMSSFFAGLLWLMTGVTAGLYFGLAYRKDISVIFIIAFYVFLVGTLCLLLLYLYRVWKR
jgi:hypothetical protein